MSHDDAALGKVRRFLLEARSDVFVRQPVKAVAAHAIGIILVGQRIAVRDLGMAAMEGGIEAGHLQELRLTLHDGADRTHVVRLMQRRQRSEGFELGRDTRQ